uniref:Uncharacterized protein n=1 Tax=Panagrolaimus sp. ES5 TaxID=591445 RepID=A0AC34F7V1_9BILA
MTSVVIIVTFIIAIFGLLCIHVTLAIEACIQKTSKQLLEQTVMREEAPDYYLGEDTKYYTYIPAEDDKPPTNAPGAVADQPAAPAPPTTIDQKALDEFLESSKKAKGNEKK